MKIYINEWGHMTNMAVLPIYNNQSAEGAGGLGITRDNKLGESE